MGHLQQMEAVALFIRNIVTRRRNSPNQRLYHYRVQVGEHLFDSLVVGESKSSIKNWNTKYDDLGGLEHGSTKLGKTI